MNFPIPRRINILGSKYSALNKEAIYGALLDSVKNKISGYVCVSNVHTTMTGYFDPSYQQITNESLFSVPDGMPLVWAMRSMGAPEQDRVRGPSMMKEMLDRGRAHGIRHYLYGGTPESLKKLQETIQHRYPGANIVGAESPPFRSIDSIAANEWKEIAEKINLASPDFIWIGIGAPKQELWMWKQKNSVRGVMFGIGAAFDLIPGIVPEAPAVLQKFGLEWFYRLIKEPRRLWRRYLFNNPAFLVLWGLQVLRFKFSIQRE